MFITYWIAYDQNDVKRFTLHPCLCINEYDTCIYDYDMYQCLCINVLCINVLCINGYDICINEYVSIIIPLSRLMHVLYLLFHAKICVDPESAFDFF